MSESSENNSPDGTNDLIRDEASAHLTLSRLLQKPRSIEDQREIAGIVRSDLATGEIIRRIPLIDERESPSVEPETDDSGTE